MPHLAPHQIVAGAVDGVVEGHVMLGVLLAARRVGGAVAHALEGALDVGQVLVGGRQRRQLADEGLRGEAEGEHLPDQLGVGRLEARHPLAHLGVEQVPLLERTHHGAAPGGALDQAIAGQLGQGVADAVATDPEVLAQVELAGKEVPAAPAARQDGMGQDGGQGA